MLFNITCVDILDAARGQVCLAERTNSCPWKKRTVGENGLQKEEKYRELDMVNII